jgi:hypothetical protein
MPGISISIGQDSFPLQNATNTLNLTTVVGSLPSAVVNSGKTAYVTDALGPVLGSPVVGGGTVYAAVISNGTVWNVNV